eukprot:1186928-Prorocentrum_minimum.AAC.2
MRTAILVAHATVNCFALARVPPSGPARGRELVEVTHPHFYGRGVPREPQLPIGATRPTTPARKGRTVRRALVDFWRLRKRRMMIGLSAMAAPASTAPPAKLARSYAASPLSAASSASTSSSSSTSFFCRPEETTQFSVLTATASSTCVLLSARSCAADVQLRHIKSQGVERNLPWFQNHPVSVAIIPNASPKATPKRQLSSV